jgi:hypothetical protein
MIRNALLLCAALLAAVTFACAQNPSLRTTAAAVALDACDGTDLSGRVQVLPPNANLSPTSSMISDLNDAYCHAPAVFRHHIDTVDYVFIDASKCLDNNNVISLDYCPAVTDESISWGMRIRGDIRRSASRQVSGDRTIGERLA